MRNIKLFSSLILLSVASAANAQDYNPYKAIGKKGNVVTLTHGKYVEHFDTDTLQRMGSVIINTRTKKVVRFLHQNDTTFNNGSPSRWLSIDPLASKYPSISPYAFVANNPIIYVDPNGAEIVLAGSAQDVGATVLRMQNAVGASYSVSQNSNGSVIMTPNAGFNGEVSAQQQSAINTFLPITSLETGKVSMSVVNNSNLVDVGSFETGQIDIGDINQYDNITNTSGEPTVYSGTGKLIHEMSEQFQKQVVGADMFDAHNTGIRDENSYNGSVRPVAVMRNGTMVAPASDESMNANSTKYTHRQNVKSSNGNTVTVVETYNVTNSKEVRKNPSTLLKTNLTDVKQTPQQH
jgi:RHS repeat-associated protein